MRPAHGGGVVALPLEVVRNARQRGQQERRALVVHSDANLREVGEGGYAARTGHKAEAGGGGRARGRTTTFIGEISRVPADLPAVAHLNEW